jgi:hypothetical protein
MYVCMYVCSHARARTHTCIHVAQKAQTQKVAQVLSKEAGVERKESGPEERANKRARASEHERWIEKGTDEECG